jgi:IS5 family transposase
MKQLNFLSEGHRLKRLSEMGDPLEKVASAMEFEIFRPILNEIFSKQTYNNGKGGRKPWDYVLMFKILLLQDWHKIADDRTEYLINDRLSYQRFLGLSLGDKVPDAKTIWLFREELTKSGRLKELFDLFENQIEEQGIITRRGSIIDAAFAQAPRQRNTRDENEKIKDGKTPEEWERPEQKAKRRQKDTDARWTKKNGITYYGYKNHIKADRDSKMIVDYAVTDASVHDSQMAAELIDKKDKCVHMDSAYYGEPIEESIREKSKSVRLSVQQKGYRGRPLTKRQKASNRRRSKIRCRVEHVFGHMHSSMGGLNVRCIGKARASARIGLKNLAYNISRLAIIQSQAPPNLLIQGICAPIYG